MILNIYKEKDWTSFDVVAKVRGLLKTKKVGHAGTLDPLAEGVLIVLTDKDTKKQNEFMSMKKEYVAEIAFGATSETYDLEGDLTFTTLPPDFDLESQIEEALPDFIGTIKQTVPAYSAVKVNGKPLYKSARKGKVNLADLPTKEVTIYSLFVKHFGSATFEDKVLPTVELICTCSKGTYIRSLAHDLGYSLGVGAVLTKLVRTKVGDFTLDDSKKLAELDSA